MNVLYCFIPYINVKYLKSVPVTPLEYFALI